LISSDGTSGSSFTPTTASARDRVTGVDIRIDRAGVGPPVVILNGLLGLNEHWFSVLPRLVRRAEVFLLQPPLLEMKGPGCSVDGVTRLIAGVLETLVDRPALLVGNSLGGHVALKLAMENHPLVRALGLVGSSGLFERSFEKNVEHSPSRQWLERKITDLFHDPSRMLPGMVDAAYGELSRRSAARALVKLGRSAKNDHLGERIAGLKTPTLLAWGRNDIVTPPEVAEQFHALLPNSRLVWIDRCGHAPQVERPDELGDAIADYLEFLEMNSRSRSAGAA
jgi:pimeloyl-ACP methyl ester carboxylesterase